MELVIGLHSAILTCMIFGFDPATRSESQLLTADGGAHDWHEDCSENFVPTPKVSLRCFAHLIASAMTSIERRAPHRRTRSRDLAS